MFRFFKTDERKGEMIMERRRISGGSRKMSRRQLGSIMKSIRQCLILNNAISTKPYHLPPFLVFFGGRNFYTIQISLVYYLCEELVVRLKDKQYIFIQSKDYERSRARYLFYSAHYTTRWAEIAVLINVRCVRPQD